MSAWNNFSIHKMDHKSFFKKNLVKIFLFFTIKGRRLNNYNLAKNLIESVSKSSLKSIFAIKTSDKKSQSEHSNKSAQLIQNEILNKST